MKFAVAPKGRSRISNPYGPSERGATLVVIALMLTIMLVGAGYAVDLSLRENRAQDMQNAADSAALAGAQSWGGGDEAAVRLAVADMLAQNGIGSDVVVDVQFPSASQVEVLLGDSNGKGLLSSFTGDGGTLTRSAVATFTECNAGCEQTIVAPPVINAIEAAGSGDGFVPIAVRNRLYAINHHQFAVSCIDRDTLEECWEGERYALPSGFQTNTSHLPGVIGDRIFYVGRGSGDVILTCFDTTFDSQCSGVVLSGAKQGQAVVVGDQVFVFTSEQKVYCYTGLLNLCPGYDGSGRDSQMASVEDINSTQNFNKSQFDVHDGKIYIQSNWQGKYWMECWDTAALAPCSAFGPYNTGTNSNFKAFFHRNALGVPQDFCSVGINHVACYQLDGSGIDAGAESSLETVRAYMRSKGWDNGWDGLVSYHEPTNTVYITDSKGSLTYCYDFVSLCGESYDITPINIVQTYGYISDGPDCMIGLGDNSVFFTKKPDLSGPCDSSTGTVEITPCTCTGQPTWPAITATEDGGALAMMVRVVDPSGTAVVPWTDLLLADIKIPDGTPGPTLTLEFEVEVAAGDDPWTAGTPPTFTLLSPETAPRLVE